MPFMSTSLICLVSPPFPRPLFPGSSILLLSLVARIFLADVNTLTGGCGQAFSTLIVSPEFAGKNSLKRHRLVNSALKEEIAAIHAWTAKCQTPEEWQRGKNATGSNEPPLNGTTDGKVEGTNA